MDQFNSIYEGFGSWIYEILPLSPFKDVIAQFGTLPYLGYINWFFPVGEALQIMAAWLTAVTAYFMWQWILRWLNVIQ